jgi:hypothetical protein
VSPAAPPCSSAPNPCSSAPNPCSSAPYPYKDAIRSLTGAWCFMTIVFCVRLFKYFTVHPKVRRR